MKLLAPQCVMYSRSLHVAGAQSVSPCFLNTIFTLYSMHYYLFKQVAKLGRTVYLLTYYGTFLTSIMNDSNCWIWSVSHLEDLLCPVASKGREELCLTRKYKGFSFSNKSKFMYIVNSEFFKVQHIQSMPGKKNHSALPLILSHLLFNIQIHQHAPSSLPPPPSWSTATTQVYVRTSSAI